MSSSATRQALRRESIASAVLFVGVALAVLVAIAAFIIPRTESAREQERIDRFNQLVQDIADQQESRAFLQRGPFAQLPPLVVQR